MPLRILSGKGEVQIMSFQKLSRKFHFLFRFCTRNWSETYTYPHKVSFTQILLNITVTISYFTRVINSAVYQKNRNKRTAVWIASTLTPITAVNSHREYSEAEHKGCDDLLELHNGCLPLHLPTFEVWHESRSMSRSHNNAMWVRFSLTKTITEAISFVVSKWGTPAMDAKQYTYCNRSKWFFWKFNSLGEEQTVSFIVSSFYVSHKLSCISRQNFTSPLNIIILIRHQFRISN